MKLHLIVVFEALFASMKTSEKWTLITAVKRCACTPRVNFPCKFSKKKENWRKPCHAKNAKKNTHRKRVRSPLSIYKGKFSTCSSKKTQVNERSVILESYLERTELPHLVRPMGIFLYYITSYMMVVIKTHWSEILGRALKISPASKFEKLKNDSSQCSCL